MIRFLKQILKTFRRYFFAFRYRHQPRVFTVTGIEEKVRFNELFDVSRFFEVEVGCGKGKFLLGRAEKHPEINFLGIDKAGKWMKKGWQRAQKKNLGNLKFLKWDAVDAVSRIQGQSVSRFHIYFPDPWPKKRHRSRRLLTAGFFKLLAAKLIKGGFIDVATDDKDYFSDIKKVVQKTGKYWDNVSESLNRRLFEPELKTNYELKFEAEGRPLYYLELRRK